MGNVTHTINGNIANICSADNATINSLKINFLPTQSGSGTPSPSNARTINGKTGLDIIKCGKNIANIYGYTCQSVSTPSGTRTTQNSYGTSIDSVDFSSNGVLTVTQSSYSGGITGAANGFFFIGTYNLIPGYSYIFHAKIEVTNNPRNDLGMSVLPNGSDPRFEGTIQNGFIDIPFIYHLNNTWPTRQLLEIRVRAKSIKMSEVMIFSNNINNTAYEVYNGTTYPVTWQTEAGTIYGGTLDLVSGILTQTYGVFKLSSDTDIKSNADGSFLSIYNIGIEPRNYVTTTPPDNLGFCDKIEVVNQTNGARTKTKIMTLFGSYENGIFYDRLYIYDINKYDTSVTNAETGKAALRAIDPTWVYKLATPITYQLTAQQLTTLRGQTNIWSNAGSVEVNYDVHETSAIKDAKKRIIMSQPSVLSIEGQFLITQHAQFAPMIQCGAVIMPTQMGSGTPSPNNIRPIVGLPEFNITRCKKNLFDEIYTNIPTSGDPVYKSIYVGDNTVTFSTTCGKNTYGYPVLYALSGKVTSGADGATNGFYNGLTRVVQPMNGYVTIGYRASGEADPRNYRTQIEIGSIATEYEPYLGTTTTINWPNSVDNVYVGTLDVLTGTLTITEKLLTLTGLESDAIWNWNGYLVPVSDSVNDNSKVHVSACSHTSYLITGGAFFNSRQSQSQDTAVVCAASSGKQIRFRNRNAATDLTTMQTWLQGQYNAGTPVQIVYELNSPVTYQLTPPQLRTFRGINNISADGTHIYISYWGHPQS